MMDCYQYKIVCEVKYEVLAITNTIQSLTLKNIQNGVTSPPEVSEEYSEKLKQLQTILTSNNIQQENFDLGKFATDCLKNADVEMNNYLHLCNSLTFART
ncbi:unnamed protein product [Caenorhabditis brenneri]